MFGRRTVKLVTLNIEEVPNFYADEYHYTVDAQSTFTCINNGTPEVIQTKTPCRITHFRKRTQREDIDTYLAIHPDVKEELAMLKLPDMVEGIKEKYNSEIYTLHAELIQRAKDIHKLRTDYNNVALELDDVKTASWYIRLKWVFTGVKYAK